MRLATYFEGAKRGEMTRVAEAMEVSLVTVSHWASGKKPVPVDRAGPLERATGGAVMRWDSRPTDWHIHWPELRERGDAPTLTSESDHAH